MQAQHQLRVPDDIKFEEYRGYICLTFGDNQSLYYGEEMWRVGKAYPESFLNAKLIKVNEGDLVVGKFYFFTSFQPYETNFSSLKCYRLYLGNGKFAFVDEKGITIQRKQHKYCYEVVLCDD